GRDVPVGLETVALDDLLDPAIALEQRRGGQHDLQLDIVAVAQRLERCADACIAWPRRDDDGDLPFVLAHSRGTRSFSASGVRRATGRCSLRRTISSSRLAGKPVPGLRTPRSAASSTSPAVTSRSGTTLFMKIARISRAPSPMLSLAMGFRR